MHRYGGSFIYGNWLSITLPTATICKWRDVREYSVTVFTSQAEENSAFDGDVYLKLTGAYGTTDELLLCNETTVRATDALMIHDGTIFVEDGRS